MYLKGNSLEDCTEYNDIHQYYPNWVAAPCEKQPSGYGNVPLFFAASMLVILMCGAVFVAIFKHFRDKNSLQEWAWNDRKIKKRAASTATEEFWRISTSHTLNPSGGDIPNNFNVVTPPATPSKENASPPPSFHMSVPPPPPYVDCLVHSFETCIEK